MARAPAQTGNRLSGTVVEWDDARGYGFIDAKDHDRLFFHISAVREHYARARIGDNVTFAVGTGRNGKPAAVDVDVAGVNPRVPEAAKRGLNRPFARESYRVYAAFLMIIVLLVAITLDRAPIWLAAAYAVLGALSFALYAVDKRRAETNAWRTPEATLHGVDLVGGIIGGLLAQHILRHKTAKVSFGVVTAGIAGLHVLFLLAIAAGSVSPAALAAILREILGSIS